MLLGYDLVLALPLAILTILVLRLVFKLSIPHFNLDFILFSFSAGVFQIIGTLTLVSLYAHKNFASAITYSKTEVLQTCVMGFFIFKDGIPSILTILGVCLGFLGIILLSRTIKGNFSLHSLIGLCSGFCFSITAFFIKKANILLLEYQKNIFFNSCYTLLVTLTIQTLILLPFLFIKYKPFFKKNNILKCFSTGSFGYLASLFWLIAFTLTSVIKC